MTQASVDNEIIRIQTRGVITIPRKFRDENFGENSFVRVRKFSGKLILEPITMLSYPIRKYTGTEVKEFLETDKHESVV